MEEEKKTAFVEHSILFRKLSGKQPHHSSAALLNLDAMQSSPDKHPAARSKSWSEK